MITPSNTVIILLYSNLYTQAHFQSFMKDLLWWAIAFLYYWCVLHSINFKCMGHNITPYKVFLNWNLINNPTRICGKKLNYEYSTFSHQPLHPKDCQAHRFLLLVCLQNMKLSDEYSPWGIGNEAPGFPNNLCTSISKDCCHVKIVGTDIPSLSKLP